jgi:TatD DNase family protein
MFWTDTHAHIYHEDFEKDLELMMERNHDAGVRKIFMPNIDSSSVDRLLSLEQKFAKECVAMMGLHPCSVKENFRNELQIIEQWLGKRRFAAIGEIGTDLYWDKSFWEQQKEAFLIQVGWAKKYSLPIVIHCRESMDQTIDLLEPLLDGKLSGIFHCFTGTAEQAQKIISMGFYLGIGGVVTFKNSGLDKIIPQIDLNKIVLETDSPYLAPVPYRGKRNEPSYIPLVAGRIAELKNITIQELQSVTTRNADRIFTSPPTPLLEGGERR